MAYAYDNALKRIIHAPKYASSHRAANICNQPLFNHHLSASKLRYYKRLENSESPMMRMLLVGLEGGLFLQDISRIERKYNFRREYDLDVLLARISFVQTHEEPRRFCVYFGV